MFGLSARAAAPRVARDREPSAGDPLVVRQQLDRSLHRGGSRPPAPGWYGLSRNQRRSSVEVITIATLAIIVACTIARSALSAKKSMKTKMIPALRKRTIQSGVGITPSAPCVRSARALSRSVALVEPLAVRGLLGRRARLDGLQRPEHGDAPRVVAVAERARLHLRPLLVHDRARVADELAREAVALGDGHELGRLELLRDDVRLVDGAAARGVEALEGEEDDEAEEHGEAGREDAEHPGRAIAVLEVAPLGRAPADEQHRGDGDDAHAPRRQRRPGEAHAVTARALPAAASSRRAARRAARRGRGSGPASAGRGRR